MKQNDFYFILKNTFPTSTPILTKDYSLLVSSLYDSCNNIGSNAFALQTTGIPDSTGATASEGNLPSRQSCQPTWSCLPVYRLRPSSSSPHTTHVERHDVGGLSQRPKTPITHTDNVENSTYIPVVPSVSTATNRLINSTLSYHWVYNVYILTTI